MLGQRSRTRFFILALTLLSTGGLFGQSVDFSVASGTITESSGTVAVSIRLSSAAPLAAPLSFEVADSGTGDAMTPEDYTFPTALLEFPTGSVNGDTLSVAIAIVDDDLVEVAQTIRLQITNVLGGTAGSLFEHTLTILDNETASVRFQLPASSVLESVALHTVQLELVTAGANLEAPVSVVVGNGFSGTAMGGVDLAPFNTELTTFDAGDGDGTLKPLTLNMINDLLVEGDETFTISLLFLAGPATLGAPIDHTITIIDDETATVSFSSNASSATEGGVQSIGLTLTTTAGALALPVTVHVTDSGFGTATSGSDYTPVTSSLVTFVPGSVSGTEFFASVELLSDLRVEGMETLQLSIGSIDGPATASAPETHEVTIEDANQALVRFAAGMDSVSENAGSLNIAIQLETGSATLESPITVEISDALSGSATAGIDYNFMQQTVTFAQGSGDGEIQDGTLFTVDDLFLEGDKTVDLTLTAVNGRGTLGATDAQTVTILDDETATVSFSSPTSSVGEQSPSHSLALTLSTAGATLQVPLTVELSATMSGLAETGSDYDFTSQSLTFGPGSTDGAMLSTSFGILDDALFEGDEDATFALANPNGPGLTLGATAQHTVTINDDETASVRFLSSSSSTNEMNATHVIDVELVTTGTLARPVTVDIVDDGTGSAAASSDYEAINGQTVTFASGAANGDTSSAALNLIDDLLVEDAETVDLSLGNPSGFVTISAPANHSVTVGDNDNASVQFSTASSSASEDSAAHTVDLVLLTGGAALEYPVTFEVSNGAVGSAVSGLDFASFVSASFTFNPGDTDGTTRSLVLPLINDALIEGDEAFQLQLAVSSGPLSLAAISEHMVMIMDDESAEFSFAAASSNVSETGGFHTVSISLLTGGAALALPLSIEVTDSGNGTATSGVDYSPFTNTTLSFLPGAQDGQLATVTLAVLPDSFIEGTETILLDIVNASTPATTLTPATHEVSILDQNNATVRFSAATSTLSEATSSIDVSVQLVAPSGSLEQPVAVEVRDTLAGTAASGLDYLLPEVNTLIFPVGSSNGATQMLSIGINEDTLVEGTQTIELLINGTTGPAAIAPESQHVISILDNEAAQISFELASSSTPEANPIHNVLLRLDTAGATLESEVSATIADLLIGTAAGGADFSLPGVNLFTFAPGSADGAMTAIPISIVQDALLEGEESIMLGINSVTGPETSIGAGDSHSIAIIDDESAELSFATPASMAAEEAGTAPIGVRLETFGATLAVPVSAQLSSLGTGTATAEDHADLSLAQVTFAEGSGNGSVQTFAIGLTDDLLLEGDEVLNLGLNTPTGPATSIGVQSAHSLTIVDNDAVSLGFATVISSPLEAVPNHPIPIRLNSGAVTLAVPITATVERIGGTAIVGTDVVDFGIQTVTFPAGSVDGTLVNTSLSAIDDLLIEGDETVNLSVSAVAGPLTSVDILSNHIATILDNEAGEVNFAIAASTVDEIATTHVVTISLLTAGATLDIPIPVEITDLGTGTASAGVDYATIGAPVLTFPGGSGDGAILTLNVNINPDTILEGNETILLELDDLNTPPVGIGPTFSQTITILDDEMGTLSYTTATTPLAETAAPTTLTVRFSTAPGVTTASPINFAITNSGGTAILGTDYQLPTPSTFTLPTGTADGALTSFDVTVLDDTLLEGIEPALLGISLISGPATLGATPIHSLDIQDDESAQVSFEIGQNSILEPSPGLSIGVRLSAPGTTLAVPVSVLFSDTMLGTAVSGLDYFPIPPTTITFQPGATDGALQTVPFTNLDDGIAESPETVSLSLSAPNGPAFTLGATTNHIITILDDDFANIGFEIATSSANELAPIQEVRLILNGAGLNFGELIIVEVTDTLSGTAESGVDYTSFGSQTFTFPPGSVEGATLAVPITISDDLLVEGAESIVLQISALTGPATIGTNQAHTISISDNDLATVSFAEATSQTTEGGLDHNVALQLFSGGATLSRPVTINLDTLGISTATAGIDYQPIPPQTAVFPAGSASGDLITVNLATLDDSLFEAPETIALQIGTIDSTAFSAGAVNTHEVTINDDEIAAIRFDSATASTVEGTGPSPIAVTLDAPGVTLAIPISVDITDMGLGTATTGVDYNPLPPTTLTFATGSFGGTTLAASLTSLDDALVEGAETIELSLENLSAPAVLGTIPQHALSIVDADNATMHFQTATSTRVEANATLTVQVALTTGDAVLADSWTVEALNLNTGTTTNGTDHIFFEQALLQFPAGSGTGALQAVSFDLFDDTTFESTETVDLVLQNPAGPGAQVGEPSTHVAAIQDDDAVFFEFESLTSSAFENSGIATVGVRLLTSGGNLAIPVTVTVSDLQTGSMLAGLDYTDFGSQDLTFPAGATNGTTLDAGLELTDDTLVEGTETVQLALVLGEVPGVGLGANQTHELTIFDDDEMNIDFSTSATTTTEGATAEVTLRLNANGTTTTAPVQVQISVLPGGSATNGIDYGPLGTTLLSFPAGSENGTLASISIPIQSDIQVESDETFTLGITSLDGLNVTLGANTEHTVTITDEDAAFVSFNVSSVNVSESQLAYQVTAVLNTAGALLTSPVIVEVSDSMLGSATAGVDYLTFATQPIVFLAGSGTGQMQSVTLTPINDTSIEADETIVLEMNFGSGIGSLGAPTTFTVNLIEDDFAEVSFTAATSTIAETEASQQIFVQLVTNSSLLSQPLNLTVEEFATGSAMSGIDYVTLGTQVVTFPAGATSGELIPLTFEPIDDPLDESDETVVLGITSLNGLGSSIVEPSQHEITIVDNEQVVSLRAFGLQHTSEGQIGLSYNAGGLNVSNISMSGLDGISIDLGTTPDSFSLTRSSPFMGAALGGGETLSLSGTIDGTPGEVSIGSLDWTATEPRGGEVALTPDFSALGVTSFQLEIYGGVSVLETLGGLTGTAATFPLPETLKLNAINDSSDPGAPALVFELEFPNNPTPITAPGGSITFGDRIRLRAEAQASVITGFSNAFFGLSGLADVTITEESIGIFGNDHYSLGDAHLNPSTNSLTVDNLGASGQDGVLVQSSGSPDLLGANVIVSPTDFVTGSQLSVAATGGLGGASGSLLGELILTGGPLGLSNTLTVIPDLAPVGATTYSLALYSAGTLVHSESGRVGPAVSFNVPSELQPALGGNLLNDLELRLDLPGGPRTMTIVGGVTSFDADRVVITAEGQSAAVQAIQELSLRGTDLSFFSITAEPMLSPDVPLIQDLNCELNGDIATVTWTPGAAYTETRVFADGVLVAVLPGAPSSTVLGPFAEGTHNICIEGSFSGLISEQTCCSIIISSDPIFLRGDPNGDAMIDVSDTIFLLLYVFGEGTEPNCLDAGDVNDDSLIDVADPIYVLDALFASAAPPPAPGFVTCGPDPTADTLSCDLYNSCP